MKLSKQVDPKQINEQENETIVNSPLTLFKSQSKLFKINQESSQEMFRSALLYPCSFVKSQVERLNSAQLKEELQKQEEMQTQSQIKRLEQNKESEQFIKQLLEQEQQFFEEQRKIKDQRDNAIFDCEICYSSLLFDLNPWGLINCGHCFHKECLLDCWEILIKERKFPLQCPNMQCNEEIHIQDIEEVLPKELVDMFWNFSLKEYIDQHNQEISWCPTADCKYAFIFDAENKNAFDFICPVCKKRYCLNCRAEFHDKQTCEEYQASKLTSKEDQEFEKFAKGQKFKQCPKCKFWVQKETGCNWMKCRCKMEFCYECGSEFDQQNEYKCKCQDGRAEKNRELFYIHNPQLRGKGIKKTPQPINNENNQNKVIQQLQYNKINQNNACCIMF